jgi:hypothetical protein
VSNILPEVDDVESLISNLPSPIMMNVGETWNENLNIGSVNAQKPTLDKVSNQVKKRRFIQHDFYEKPSPIK